MNLLGRSLRLRLSVLILCPLIIVSMVATYWRYDSARATAEDIFDRNLVMLCLAVSRDVANSGGDTLSDTTANLFRDASGGTVFYHVNGPDGSFVTGYSSPPVRGADIKLNLNAPLLFDAQHQGAPVRAASLAERVEIDGIVGVSVVTVWQQLEPRTAFAQNLAAQAAILALVLVATVATLVLFGVRLGLRPLNQLELAIQKRSPEDLSPIERQVPVEARGIVARLNSLFRSVTDAKSAQDRLISNAAHQLRNPVAATHAMAQATLAAKTPEDSKARAAELVQQTRQTVRLTQQMLSLERIKGRPPHFIDQDLNTLVKEIAQRVGPGILRAGKAFELALHHSPIFVKLDPVLLAEAITNLTDNALRHGGGSLTCIKISTTVTGTSAHIYVENDGAPLSPKAAEQLFDRFQQGSQNGGAGLGLAIAKEIAALHGGTLRLCSAAPPKFMTSLALP